MPYLVSKFAESELPAGTTTHKWVADMGYYPTQTAAWDTIRDHLAEAAAVYKVFAADNTPD